MQNSPIIALEPNRRITSGQLHDCLSAALTLVGCLRTAAGTTDSISSGELPASGVRALDGEVRSSLEASLIHVCNRIDEIVGNGKRWEEPDRDMHVLGVKVLEQQIMMQQQSIRNTEMQLKALQQRLDDETQLFREAVAATLAKEFSDRLKTLNGETNSEPPPPTQKTQS